MPRNIPTYRTGPKRRKQSPRQQRVRERLQQPDRPKRTTNFKQSLRSPKRRQELTGYRQSRKAGESPDKPAWLDKRRESYEARPRQRRQDRPQPEHPDVPEVPIAPVAQPGTDLGEVPGDPQERLAYIAAYQDPNASVEDRAMAHMRYYGLLSAAGLNNLDAVGASGPETARKMQEFLIAQGYLAQPELDEGDASELSDGDVPPGLDEQEPPKRKGNRRWQARPRRTRARRRRTQARRRRTWVAE